MGASRPRTVPPRGMTPEFAPVSTARVIPRWPVLVLLAAAVPRLQLGDGVGDQVMSNALGYGSVLLGAGIYWQWFVLRSRQSARVRRVAFVLSARCPSTRRPRIGSAPDAEDDISVNASDHVLPVRKASSSPRETGLLSWSVRDGLASAA